MWSKPVGKIERKKRKLTSIPWLVLHEILNLSLNASQGMVASFYFLNFSNWFLSHKWFSMQIDKWFILKIWFLFKKLWIHHFIVILEYDLTVDIALRVHLDLMRMRLRKEPSTRCLMINNILELIIIGHVCLQPLPSLWITIVDWVCIHFLDVF